MKMSKVLDVLLEGGENTNTLFITFKEGINMREVAKVISENTDNTEDDVNLAELKQLEEGFKRTDDI